MPRARRVRVTLEDVAALPTIAEQETFLAALPPRQLRALCGSFRRIRTIMVIVSLRFVFPLTRRQRRKEAEDWLRRRLDDVGKDGA